MIKIIKYLGLILILLSCNSINKKNDITTSDENSKVISVSDNTKQESTNKKADDYKIDKFLITDNSVGIFNKGMTIGEVQKIVPKNQIKKKIGFGEYEDDTFDDYEIYDKNNQHLLTLTPLIQNDLNSTINRILIIDKRFKTKSGIGIESKYSELIESYKVTEYSPDLEHIVITVKEIGAWFSIRKTELEQNWWDDKTKEINTSKIPSKSHFDSIVIWWN